MFTLELENYVRAQIQNGVDRASIAQSFLASGWSQVDVDAVFRAIDDKGSIKKKEPRRFLKWFIIIGLGLSLFLFLANRYLFISNSYKSLFKNIRLEFALIYEELKDDYPELEFAFDVKQTDSGSVLHLLTKSNSGLSSDLIDELGIKVCTMLPSRGAKYSSVMVGRVETKKFLLFGFSKSEGLGKSCEEWLGDAGVEEIQPPDVGFAVLKPKIIPEGCSIAKYDVDQSPQRITLITNVLCEDNKNILFSQFLKNSMSTSDLEGSIERLYGKFGPRRMEIDDLIVFEVVKPSIYEDDSRVRLLTYEDEIRHLNIWFYPVDGFTEEESTDFIRGLYGES